MEVIKKCQKQKIEVENLKKNLKVYIETGMPDFSTFYLENKHTGSSRLMRISLLRISLLGFFKTITKIWLMRFFGLKILLLRT